MDTTEGSPPHEMRCNTCRHKSWYRDGSSQAHTFGAVEVVDGKLWVEQLHRWAGYPPEKFVFRARLRMNRFLVTDTLRMKCRRGHEVRVRQERLAELVEKAHDGTVWL